MRRLLYLFAAVALPLLLVNSAWATHPNIAATPICDAQGNLVIQYTSTAWDTTSIYAANSEIDILFNGVKVAQGAYTAGNGYSFSGTAPAPMGSGPGDTVVVTAFAKGLWAGIYDGGQSTSISITLPTDGCIQPGLGRFTGGGSQIRIDYVRVTKGLTIHCDLLLSNNLEVNWNGNSFHMTEHLTTVACTDSPDIIQAPPVAPLDTLIGIGTGRYNNMDGYTINFTLIDAGEPGSSDMAKIYIYETANPAHVVLDLPLSYLSGGNLQAHYDQPHK